MQYVVIYMRVQEGKKGLAFNGPFYGPGDIHDTNEEAEAEVRALINDNKSGTIMAKIFAIPEDKSFTTAMSLAKPIFQRMKEDIIETKEMIDRPVARRKRKSKPL
jgi:hypothetical protein